MITEGTERFCHLIRNPAASAELRITVNHSIVPIHAMKVVNISMFPLCIHLECNLSHQSPFFSNQRNSSMPSTTMTTMTGQWLTPRIWGIVILPKSPQVRTVAFKEG